MLDRVSCSRAKPQQVFPFDFRLDVQVSVLLPTLALIFGSAASLLGGFSHCLVPWRELILVPVQGSSRFLLQRSPSALDLRYHMICPEQLELSPQCAVQCLKIRWEQKIQRASESVAFYKIQKKSVKFRKI
jgi:hypothetical protein